MEFKRGVRVGFCVKGIDKGIGGIDRGGNLGPWVVRGAKIPYWAIDYRGNLVVGDC